MREERAMRQDADNRSDRCSSEQRAWGGGYVLENRIEPAETCTLPFLSNEQVASFLREHGCQIRRGIQQVLLVYPAGTTRQRLLPTTMEERFRLRLPDGTEMREVHGRWRVNNLLVPNEAFSSERPAESPSGEEPS